MFIVFPSVGIIQIRFKGPGYDPVLSLSHKLPVVSLTHIPINMYLKLKQYRSTTFQFQYAVYLTSLYLGLAKCEKSLRNIVFPSFEISKISTEYCSYVDNIAMRTKFFVFFELFLQDTFLHLPVG